MVMPLCACLRNHGTASSTNLIPPMLLINHTSKYLFSRRTMWLPENVFFISYRFYNKPALRNSNESSVIEKPKIVDILEPKRKVPLIERLAKKFIQAVPKRSVERWKLTKASSYMYEQLCDEVNVAQFFEEFDMPDTFASWFVVMELHVYVLATRVFKHEVIGIHTRDMLTDNFWIDVQYRASKLGDRAAVLRKKQLCILGMQFQAAFYGYDEGVQSNDKVLAAIVWRRFFASECDDAEKIERVVKYIRVQLDYLNSLTFEDVTFNRAVLTIPLKNVQVG